MKQYYETSLFKGEIVRVFGLTVIKVYLFILSLANVMIWREIALYINIV